MFRITITKLATTVLPAAAVLAAAGVTSVLGAGSAAAATSAESVHVVNNSNETMTVTSASKPYGHWQDRAAEIARHTANNLSNSRNWINGNL